MQGERASLGSLSEALNLEHGSTPNNTVIDQQIRWENTHNLVDHELHDYMISAADTNTTFANSVYHEQHGLHRFSLGEASSSRTKNEVASHSEQWMGIGRLEEHRNDKLLLNPYMRPPSGNRLVRNVNLNAEYNEQLEDMNHVTGHTGLFEVNGLRSGRLPENSVRAGLSIEERRASCKRKAIDGSIGQSSSSGAFPEFHHGESSSRVSAPSFYSPEDYLSISLDHGPRGLVSGVPESSSRGFSVRANPTYQQETVSPSVFAAGSVIRRPVGSSLNSPVLVPENQQLFDLRYGHSASPNPNASPIHMPHVSRNMIPPFQWSGSPISATPVDRSIIHSDETGERSNNLEIPLFVPGPQQRNLAHGHISNRIASGPGHVASSSSRTSVQPSPSNLPLNHYQINSPHQRRLSEQLRRIATNQRAARSLVPPAAPDEHVVQSGGGNTFQMQNRAYSRAGPRQVQNEIGVPHSLRGLTSTSRGRSRMGASEIRSVLDHMRRRGDLRFEEAMLLNHLGVADIHDRYRDMRLDVDNMTYEELLSLEEQIGDVCTGLNEETILNRLKQQKYKSRTRSTQEVEPCSICQEEYKKGEDMGMLECGHGFHTQCIKEWLKRKNLCPICKTTGLNTAEKPRR